MPRERQGLRWLFLGGGLALAALIPLADPFGLRSGADRAYTRAHQRLLDSLAETRPLEARVTGESAYRPFQPTTAAPVEEAERKSTDRGVNPSPGPQVPREIVRTIQVAVKRDPSLENQATLAILLAVTGHPREGVRLLRKTQSQKPDDPRLLNDLAAALLAVRPDEQNPWPALEAIEAAQHSLKLEPSLPALFNLALALERSQLRTRAITAWRNYLNDDASSDWAQEAAWRLNRLEQDVAEQTVSRSVLDFPAIPENPWVLRQRGERTLLSRWAEQTLGGRETEAEATLDEAEALVGALPRGGGRLLAASIQAIREAVQTQDRVRITHLAQGHKAFGQGLSFARQEHTGTALSFLEAAIQHLHLAETPFELRARTQRALIRKEPDWAELQQLERLAQRDGFPSIVAEGKFITASRISLEGRLEAAIGAYRDAQRRFEELDEKEMSAVLAVMLAELLDALGYVQESDTQLAAALAAGPWVVDPWNRYSVYVVAASSVVGRFGRAAVELRLEAADACRDLGRPLCAADSWLWVAALTPDAGVAEEALHKAEELLLSAPESDGKDRTRIDFAAAQARWLAMDNHSEEEWEESVTLYRKAAASYMSKGRAVSAARARSSLAGILDQLGRSAEASAEYRAGLEAIRLWDQSDRFRPDSDRQSPRELREVYEKLIDIELHLVRGALSPEAFLLSEEMRDRLAPRQSAELWLPGKSDIDWFVDAVPPATAIIEYAVYEDRVIAWTLAAGRLDQVILSPQGELGKRIGSLALEQRFPSWKRASGSLFQDLVGPVLERLPDGIDHLVLVPDSELYGLPFRALWVPVSGRYLDEEYTITLAPSVRQFLDSGTKRPNAPARPGLTALSLGFGVFDASLGLDTLPWAVQEADSVRRAYNGAISTNCAATDWASFRRCAPLSNVLHLATHAWADSTSSRWSWLAFERETVSLDLLWRELPDLPLRPLVVLSACQSVAAGGGGEGLGGLARPFLARGARAVVGTLWKIRDEDAADLFPVFHQSYQESGDVAGALRAARESMDDWAERPWTWGAVEVVSGGN